MRNLTERPTLSRKMLMVQLTQRSLFDRESQSLEALKQRHQAMMK